MGFGQAESLCSAKLFGRICLEAESILLTGALGCLGGISSLGSSTGTCEDPNINPRMGEEPWESLLWVLLPQTQSCPGESTEGFHSFGAPLGSGITSAPPHGAGRELKGVFRGS